MRNFGRSTLIGLSLSFLSSIFTSHATAEEYYIYRDPKGALVLSNQKPPENSQIIKQMSIPDQPAEQPIAKPPEVQVRPQAESKVKERRSNVPADDLAPYLSWVWA